MTTRSDFEFVLAGVLGERTFAGLKAAQIGLPRIVDMAALQLFQRGDATSVEAGVIRFQRAQVERTGAFQFEPEGQG